MSSYDYNNRFTRRNWLGGEPADLHVGHNNRPHLYRPSLFPTGTSFPTQIIFLNDGIANSVNPSFRQFIQELPPTLTTSSQQWQRQPPPPPSQEADSNLTEEEQQKALNKLEKKIYNPQPKNKTKKWCLYYRDNNTKNMNKEENSDAEDKKGCAICLEDFVSSEEVINTPCNHMFHEECIVPWVKSHGQCPICRAAFGERRQEVCLPALNNTGNNNNAANFTATDLVSLLRAAYGIR